MYREINGLYSFPVEHLKSTKENTMAGSSPFEKNQSLQAGFALAKVEANRP